MKFVYRPRCFISKKVLRILHKSEKWFLITRISSQYGNVGYCISKLIKRTYIIYVTYPSPFSILRSLCRSQHRFIIVGCWIVNTNACFAGHTFRRFMEVSFKHLLSTLFFLVRNFFILYLIFKYCHGLPMYMEDSEPKWVNSIFDIIGVTSLRPEGQHIWKIWNIKIIELIRNCEIKIFF